MLKSIQRTSLSGGSSRASFLPFALAEATISSASAIRASVFLLRTPFVRPRDFFRPFWNRGMALYPLPPIEGGEDSKRSPSGAGGSMALADLTDGSVEAAARNTEARYREPIASTLHLRRSRTPASERDLWIRFAACTKLSARVESTRSSQGSHGPSLMAVGSSLQIASDDEGRMNHTHH
jgi:hypothetical protein